MFPTSGHVYIIFIPYHYIRIVSIYSNIILNAPRTLWDHQVLTFFIFHSPQEVCLDWLSSFLMTSRVAVGFWSLFAHQTRRLLLSTSYSLNGENLKFELTDSFSWRGTLPEQVALCDRCSVEKFQNQACELMTRYGENLNYGQDYHTATWRSSSIIMGWRSPVQLRPVLFVQFLPCTNPTCSWTEAFGRDEQWYYWTFRS